MPKVVLGFVCDHGEQRRHISPPMVLNNLVGLTKRKQGNSYKAMCTCRKETWPLIGVAGCVGIVKILVLFSRPVGRAHMENTEYV